MSKIPYLNYNDVISDAKQVIEFSGTILDPDNFRTSYFSALNSIQKIQYPVELVADGPLLNFNVGGKNEQDILSTFGSQDNLSFEVNNCAYSSKEQISIRENWNKGLALIKDFDEEIYNLVNAVDAQYLFAKTNSHVGGSFWYLIGVIWMSPNAAEWVPADYAENILHETIHQSMFLRDMVQTLFSRDIDYLAQEEALVKSAIRKVRRPFDFAFHAATVSVALVKFYEYLQDSRKVKTFYDGSVETLQELKAKKELLSDQGQQILKDMFSSLNLN